MLPSSTLLPASPLSPWCGSPVVSSMCGTLLTEDILLQCAAVLTLIA